MSTLGIPGTEIQHESNKVKVCKRLEKSLNCIGLVDEDPSSVQPTYIKRLEEKLHVHNMLCPRLEVWILEAAQEARINLGNYDLPNSAEGLHNVVNTKVGKFMNLIQNIKKKKSKMLRTLEDLLKTK